MLISSSCRNPRLTRFPLCPCFIHRVYIGESNRYVSTYRINWQAWTRTKSGCRIIENSFSQGLSATLSRGMRGESDVWNTWFNGMFSHCPPTVKLIIRFYERGRSTVQLNKVGSGEKRCGATRAAAPFSWRDGRPSVGSAGRSLWTPSNRVNIPFRPPFSTLLIYSTSFSARALYSFHIFFHEQPFHIQSFSLSLFLFHFLICPRPSFIACHNIDFKVGRDTNKPRTCLSIPLHCDLLINCCTQNYIFSAILPRA